jgi:beta-N-acetylhexosaminidase
MVTKTGADQLLSEQIELIANKNLGIITNHSAILANGTHLVDTLFNSDNVNIIALFGPEHGIRGDAPDGHSIKDGVDSKTGIPVYSLYGKTRQPTSEMLENIDLLVFDIQDIGARFYTFISTMYYSIKSAAEHNIPIIILDRPNPINGLDVQGPVLDPNFQSFVGIAEIPIRHGMTVGELALFFNRSDILDTDNKANLTIVKMKDWSRDYYYDETGLKWIKPSPNMPNLETAIVYPGLCLIEGTNISEGRGTYLPFLNIGAPYSKSEELISELEKLDIEGCFIRPSSFIPVEISDMSKYPKYKDEKCEGIELTVSDRAKFKPIDFGIKLIYVYHKLYPQNFSFRESRIDKLWGNSFLRESLKNGDSPESIIRNYKKELEKFKLTRKKYLLY